MTEEYREGGREGGCSECCAHPQEEYREQCGDGTPDGGDTMLFPCQPGHAVFTPVAELLPDARFMITEATNRESCLVLYSVTVVLTSVTTV